MLPGHLSCSGSCLLWACDGLLELISSVAGSHGRLSGSSCSGCFNLIALLCSMKHAQITLHALSGASLSSPCRQCHLCLATPVQRSVVALVMPCRGLKSPKPFPGQLAVWVIATVLVGSCMYSHSPQAPTRRCSIIKVMKRNCLNRLLMHHPTMTNWTTSHRLRAGSQCHAVLWCWVTFDT